ncbi:hypothetical protein ACWPKO_15315 [Coraliomargarita sp. W4R53]
MIHVDSTEFTVGGTTQTLEANLATIGGNTDNFSNNAIVGTDVTATISSAPPNNDWYLNYNATALDINGETAGTGLDVATYRYVQIFYNLEDDFSGSTQQLRLATPAQGADFDTFTNSGLIASSAGDHSIIIDLLSDNGTDLSGTWSGTWTTLRWDIFNSPNAEKTFTFDKVVYGSAISAIPEPATSALFIGFGALLLIGSRRRKA